MITAALALILYLAVALGVAAELVDRRRALPTAIVCGGAWPFFAGFALGAAMTRICDR
jgi:hypothetical protein